MSSPMSDIILYDKPECPFCWKIRLALAELGLDADVVHYHSPGHEERWRALTPNNTVPVFNHQGIVIYESDIILEYLEDITGQLLPKSPQLRIKARNLNRYSNVDIGKGLREVIFEKRDKPEKEWDWQRIEQGIQLFNQNLEFLSEQLCDNEYFCGQYSFPECALTARFGLAETYGVEIPDRFSNLQTWFTRMKLRDSYQKTAPF